MTSATSRLSRVSVAALVATAFAVPAAAGQVDYYLKIEGIEGEAAAAAHEDWIEIQSVSWGNPVRARGGVNVAAGDVNNDLARRKGNVETTWKVEKGEKARPAGAAPGSVKAKDPDPQAVGLLLPAVQKARATVRGSYPGCRVGETRDQVVATDSTGKRYVLKDVTITECNRASAASGDVMPTETISLNFAKME